MRFTLAVIFLGLPTRLFATNSMNEYVRQDVIATLIPWNREPYGASDAGELMVGLELSNHERLG